MRYCLECCLQNSSPRQITIETFNKKKHTKITVHSSTTSHVTRSDFRRSLTQVFFETLSL